MADRRIENLDGIGEGEGGSETAASAKSEAKKLPRIPDSMTPVKNVVDLSRRPEFVNINYPNPTPVSVIVKDVARWSGEPFAMDPTVNPRLTIFAPEQMHPEDAFKLFLSSLSIVNLRAVQSGNVTKIVPIAIAIVV